MKNLGGEKEMDRFSLSSKTRSCLGIIAFVLAIGSVLLCVWSLGLSFIIISCSGFIVAVAIFANSTEPYEPALPRDLRIRYHLWRTKVRMEDLRINEKVNADIRNEIELRKLRVKELENEL